MLILCANKTQLYSYIVLIGQVPTYTYKKEYVNVTNKNEPLSYDTHTHKYNIYILYIIHM